MPNSYGHNPQFQKLLAGRSDVDLANLMIEFAVDAYPALDAAACLAELDEMGWRAREALELESDPNEETSLRRQLQCLGRVLYDVEGFFGNDDQYYDPRNSYLNEVLRRRCGIPITLAIVYLTVAERAGVNLFGVASPGHFLVGGESHGRRIFVDPFAAGKLLGVSEVRAMIREKVGEPQLPDEYIFMRATPLDIAARVLRNLKAAYSMDNRWEEVVPVQERLAALLPGKADEQRDLGLIYLRSGRPQPALTILDKYLKACEADEAKAIVPFVRTARRLVAELN